MKRLVLIVAALAMLVSLSACAGSGSGARLTHQEYEREMQAIARDMQARTLGMQRLASAPSYDTFTQLLRELGDLVGEAGDRLDSINPPEEIEGAHGTLADRLDEVADILDEAADEAEDGDFFAAMAVLERAPDFLDADVRDAIRDIRTAGFYIGDESDWG